jgi:hypothetical protein
LERLLLFISGLNSPFFPFDDDTKNVEPSLLPFGRLSSVPAGCSFCGFFSSVAFSPSGCCFGCLPAS